jgi:hypothetical protein
MNELTPKDQQVLEAFVLRARKIAGSQVGQRLTESRSGGVPFSIYTNPGYFGFTEPKTGMAMTCLAHVMEHELIVVAALSRPLLLKRDTIHFDAVFRAMSKMVDTPARHETIAALNGLWKMHDLDSAVRSDDLVLTDWTGDRGTSVSYPTRKLARSWLYRELVHVSHDEIHEESVSGADLQLRYVAASVIFCRIVAIVFDLSSLLLDLDREQRILDPRVWDSDNIGKDPSAFSLREHFVNLELGEWPHFNTPLGEMTAEQISDIEDFAATSANVVWIENMPPTILPSSLRD